MTSLSLTFVCHPFGPTLMSSGPERYMPFVDAVGRYGGQSVPFIQASLRDAAPTSGFVLFAGANVKAALEECPLARRSELASRLIPIDASRTRILERLLEPLSLAAAIDDMSLREWETQTERLGASGLFGLQDVGKRVGAESLLYESERYCYLRSPTHHGLPHLLVDYLKELGMQRESVRKESATRDTE